MRKTILWVTPLLFFSNFISCFSIAQDYPYDDTSLRNVKPEKTPKESDVQTPTKTATNLRTPSLFRLGIKLGANFALLQSPTQDDATTTVNTTGFGAEGLVSFNWDLAYQPLSLEFETGYKNYLLSTGTSLHALAMGFGTYYRIRSGTRSLFKIGAKSSAELRLQNSVDPDTGVNSTQWGWFPGIALSTQFEIDHLAFEPLVQINRIESGASFVAFAFRVGMLF